MCGDGSHRYHEESEEARKNHEHSEVMAAQKKNKERGRQPEKVAA